MVRPLVVVMLGLSAARGILGKTVTRSDFHGATIDLGANGSGVITVHPSYILRLSNEQQKQAEFANFVQDLARASSMLGAV
jgi:uracil-DNA glycosylase